MQGLHLPDPDTIYVYESANTAVETNIPWHTFFYQKDIFNKIEKKLPEDNQQLVLLDNFMTQSPHNWCMLYKQ